MFQEATRFANYDTKPKYKEKDRGLQDAIMRQAGSKSADLIFLVRVMLESIKLRHSANVKGQDRLYFNELTNHVIQLTNDIQ